jgi:hypothetical protein
MHVRRGEDHMTRRPELVAFAAALDGLSANPSSDRGRYLDLIAHGESDVRAAQMALMSDCGLVARGILQELGVQHVRLYAPYVTGHAMSDLVAVARDAGALHGPERTPEPGDFVIVGGGVDGGGPEHVWMCLPDGEGVDGGQRDAEHYEAIRIRKHDIDDGWDAAHDDGVRGFARRKVRWVIDCEQVLAALG